MDEQFIWVEKYRHSTIDECVLPESLKDTFKEFIASGQLPNFLFCGSAGCGKTTVAKALCNEVGAEYLFINGSEESGIDVIRTKIKNFASSVSLTDSKKIVILDEADYLNPNSTQPALRAFIEEFSGNCRFIFTCNFKNRIIEPLHSRCAVVEFKTTPKDKPAVATAFFKRVTDILSKEGIEHDQKDKNFKEVRKWVAKNSDIETTQLFSDLFNNANTKLTAESVPQMVLILADYQYKAAFVADHELNKMAALTEIMASCKFK